MRRVSTLVSGLVVVLWIAYTLSVVVRFGGAVVLDSDTTSRIMSVRNDDQLFSAVGLTYHGLGGAALVIVEVAVVSTGALMALFARGRWRVAGLVALLGWTALWLGNAIWLQRRGWDHPRDVALIGVAMLVTLAWAALRALPVISRTTPTHPAG